MADRLTLLEAYPFDSKFAGYDAEGYPVYDRAVDASWLREALSKIFKDGVFPDDANALKVTAGTSGLTASVAVGMAIIDGAIGGWRGEARTVTLLTAAPQGDVICSVLLRFDNNEDYRSIYLVVREGEIGATIPPAPVEAPSVKELRLGYVMVPSGSTDLSSATIVDERGTDLCPYATPFERLDLSAIFAAAEAETDEFVTQLAESVSGTLELLQSAVDETTAGYLQAQIDELRESAASTEAIAAYVDSQKDVEGGIVSYDTYVEGVANAGTPDDVTIGKTAANALYVKDFGITANKIAGSSVTTSKVADAAITSDKVSDAGVTGIKQRMGFGEISSITYGTADLTAGTSALDSGAVYFVYA